MANSIKSIFLVLVTLAVLVFCIDRISKVDRASDTKWSICEIQFEASNIPFEGRQDFMKECFESK